MIERRLENLLALDYPTELARRSSSPRTRPRTARDEIVEAIAAASHASGCCAARAAGRWRHRTARCASTNGEVVAFSDANATWAPDALRLLVRPLRRPGGGLRLRPARAPDRRTAEQGGPLLALRAELREAESALGSVTGGNGSIYAVRRSDYVEVDPRFGHDLSLPYLLVQRGRRAVYEPDALAFEKPTPTTEDEYRRKVRMFEHCWLIVSEGRMLRGLRAALPRSSSSRIATCATGAACSTSSCRLELPARRRGAVYRLASRATSRSSPRRRGGPGMARYYVLVTWATVGRSSNYARRGVPAVWEKAPGTRVREILTKKRRSRYPGSHGTTAFAEEAIRIRDPRALLRHAGGSRRPARRRAPFATGSPGRSSPPARGRSGLRELAEIVDRLTRVDGPGVHPRLDVEADRGARRPQAVASDRPRPGSPGREGDLRARVTRRRLR